MHANSTTSQSKFFLVSRPSIDEWSDDRPVVPQRWELDENTLKLVKTRMEDTNSQYLNFVGVVGSRRAFRSFYSGIGTIEGIIMHSLPEKVGNEVSYALEVHAPHADADSYAVLMEFVLLVCSHVVYVQRHVKEPILVWPRAKTAIVFQNGVAPGVRKQIHMVVKPEIPAYYNRQTGTTEVALGSVDSLAALTALLKYWPKTKLHADSNARQQSLSAYINMFRNAKEFAPDPLLKKENYVATLLKYLDCCNNPTPLLPSTPPAAGIPRPTNNMDKLVAVAVKSKCLGEFNEFIGRLKNILFLEEAVLTYEFRAFVSEAARKGFQSFVYNVPLASLENMIAEAFQSEFCNFKREYLSKAHPLAGFQQQIDNRLQQIEEVMKESWKNGTLTQFISLLPKKYENDLTRFNYPNEGYNVISQLQLRLSKCNQHHEKCVRSAALVLQSNEKQMHESFANHLQNPSTVPLPTKPAILESHGVFSQVKSLNAFVKQAVDEKYKFMLELCEGQKINVEKGIAATALALREEAKKRFQQQAAVSITSAMNGITLAK